MVKVEGRFVTHHTEEVSVDSHDALKAVVWDALGLPARGTPHIKKVKGDQEWLVGAWAFMDPRERGIDGSPDIKHRPATDTDREIIAAFHKIQDHLPRGRS